MTKQQARRVAQMRKYRERGWTLQRIATKYGISRQRVHTLLSREH